MELFASLMLGLVQSVLGEVIGELINGKIKAVRKAQIEEKLTRELYAQSSERGEDMKQLVTWGMKEIEVLSSRNPDLKVTNDQIKLASPFIKIDLPFEDKDKKLNKELNVRLQRLNNIIVQRREELGLLTLPVVKEQHQSTLTEKANLQEPCLGRTSVNEEAVEEHPKSISTEEASFQEEPLLAWIFENEEAYETPVAKKLKEMQDRIRSRRNGETIADEQ